MTISSLTSSTNNLVSINGATSLLTVYNINNKVQTISNASANPSLTISCTSSQLGQIIYASNASTWETGVRGSANGSGTATGNCFYWYNGGFRMSITPAGIINWYNTSVSTTSTSNAFQIAGGLYMNKAILNNSYYNCNTVNNGATSHSVSTQAICLNDQAIYFRNQNGSDTNHGLMYSKQSGWNSGNDWPSANLDGPVLFGNNSVIIGNN